MKQFLRATGGLVFACLLASCAPDPGVRFFTPEQYPTKLSDWNLFTPAQQGLALSPGNDVYELNMALFTDYAHKLRTLYVPPDAHLTYHNFEAFAAPTGTIISKTFFYNTNAKGEVDLQQSFSGDPGNLGPNFQLIETRLLVKQDHGWDALPYIWRADDAYLKITGDLMSLPLADETNLNYLVPSRNQCASCHATNHTTAAIQPIGLKARHMNKAHPVSGTNQLTSLSKTNRLANLPDDVPANASLRSFEPSELAHAARSYLDINCGHCHNPQGAADTSGLLLDYQDHSLRDLGACKPPIAAGRGSGGHLYSIVPGQATASIMTYRMATTDPGTMMPELGRSLVHREGVSLVTDWINSISGECL